MQIMPEEKFEPCKKGMVEAIELDGALERLTPSFDDLEKAPELLEVSNMSMEEISSVLNKYVEKTQEAKTCPLCGTPNLRIFGVRRISWSLTGAKMEHSIRVECTECLKFLEKEAEAQDMAGLYVLAGDSVDVDDNP